MKFLIILTTLLSSVLVGRAEFAVKDGDTVVFLGDSITAARGYSKIVENYTLLRYPQRKVHFINAGVGGDTAFGALSRLDHDVFQQKATVLTVAFGINDIKWGVAADPEHKQRYLNGIQGIVKACQKHHVRVFICSAAITAEDPDTAEKGYLQQMTDEGLALAKSLGAETIDLQRDMRQIQRRVVAANAADPKEKTALHVQDGVHLNDLGQLAMAYAILKGLGAPTNVSDAVIDAQAGKLVRSEGCKVTQIRAIGDGGVAFTRLDEGLPLSLGILGALNYRFIPIPEGLNQYCLTIHNLPTGIYTILAEGRSLGNVSAADLQKGLNIASMTADGWHPGGPWDVQADTIIELTDARDKAWQSGIVRNRYLPNHPIDRTLNKKTQTIDDDIVNLQRTVAHPYPYHFEIKKSQ